MYNLQVLACIRRKVLWHFLKFPHNAIEPVTWSPKVGDHRPGQPSGLTPCNLLWITFSGNDTAGNSRMIGDCGIKKCWDQEYKEGKADKYGGIEKMVLSTFAEYYVVNCRDKRLSLQVRKDHLRPKEITKKPSCLVRHPWGMKMDHDMKALSKTWIAERRGCVDMREAHFHIKCAKNPKNIIIGDQKI